MRREHPGNGCDHDLRQEVNEDKGGELSTYGCIATQYFCHECKLSFCGKCVLEARIKNENAYKLLYEIESDQNKQAKEVFSPKDGTSLLKDQQSGIKVNDD